MIIFVLTVGVLACYQIQYAGRNNFYEGYIAKESIQAIKGIFLLLVFARHFSQYVVYTSTLSKPYILIDRYLGQLIVVPFLFYSGYGIGKSIRQRGYNYVRDMPVKRVLNVLFQFDIAVMLYGAAQIIFSNPIGTRHFLLSLIAWDSLGNSNWYIFAILALYLISWAVCVGLYKDNCIKNQNAAGWLIGVLSFCLIWILKDFRPAYCYNTIMVYTAGFLYAAYNRKIEKFCFQSDRSYYLILSVLCVGFYVFRKSWHVSLVAYEAASILFALIIIAITAKITVQNKILKYCGEHLFSLYILQRLPMFILSKTCVIDFIPLYFVLCLVISFGLSWVFDLIIPEIWKAIEGTLLKQKELPVNK